VTAPRLLAISDRKRLSGLSLTDWALDLGRRGVTALRVREADLDDSRLVTLLTTIAGLPTRPRLLVSGRPDLAAAVGAEGVHLPSDGLPCAEIRRTWGSDLLIGCSAHTIDEEGGRRHEHSRHDQQRLPQLRWIADDKGADIAYHPASHRAEKSEHEKVKRCYLSAHFVGGDALDGGVLRRRAGQPEQAGQRHATQGEFCGGH
jgi:hypothetical protein